MRLLVFTVVGLIAMVIGYTFGIGGTLAALLTDDPGMTEF